MTEESRKDLRGLTAAARAERRRLVGMERSYRCDGCGGEHRSWTRMRTCPDCGTSLSVAVIRRAALA